MDDITIRTSTNRAGGDGHELPLAITRYWTSLLMLLVGLFGLIANVLAIKFIRKNPMLQSNFGFLLIFQALCGGGILMGFIFWVVPMTVTRANRQIC
uniref:7TM GPCR serpentine receptor class x (Srx) domain-containing protein n=1 Tax=Panagrolaimus sp. JU765 TaxID=591449 RepID=A0AC34R726_9BILA